MVIMSFIRPHGLQGLLDGFVSLCGVLAFFSTCSGTNVFLAGGSVLGSSDIPFCECSLSVYINFPADSCHLAGPDRING